MNKVLEFKKLVVLKFRKIKLIKYGGISDIKKMKEIIKK